MTQRIQQALERLMTEPCLLVVTAHQPNFFPYGGVIRKATLIYVLAQKLSQALSLPAVSLFAVADQDFTDDRWVRSTQIPDVQRRGGTLQLRFSLPEKTRLSEVPKPSKIELDNWRGEIENWIYKKLKAIEQSLESSGATPKIGSEVSRNFEDFWVLVERAYEKAASYSDFNAFLLSMIVDHVWGYDTLFCRFSESQRVFKDEFNFLISSFERYSQHVMEATVPGGNEINGVSKQEYLNIPFWYHCSCGSKARLAAANVNPLIGRGQCVRCGKEFEFDLGPVKSELSEILERISARSITMPLVFLNGIKACCYVGGAGAREYLRQAEYVAQHLGIVFPPVPVWRPLDTYLGLGQLEALITIRTLSGTFDISRRPALKMGLLPEIDEIQRQVSEIESEKLRLRMSGLGNEEKTEKIRALGVRQEEIRKQNNLSGLARNLGLLENVESVTNLCPSVIDYAINVGLKATSDQWITYLNEDGSLLSNVSLRTIFDDSLPEPLKRSLGKSDA
jgi:hypothetical protein